MSNLYPSVIDGRAQAAIEVEGSVLRIPREERQHELTPSAMYPITIVGIAAEEQSSRIPFSGLPQYNGMTLNPNGPVLT